MSFFSKQQTADDGVKSPQIDLKQLSILTTHHLTNTHHTDSMFFFIMEGQVIPECEPD